MARTGTFGTLNLPDLSIPARWALTYGSAAATLTVEALEPEIGVSQAGTPIVSGSGSFDFGYYLIGDRQVLQSQTSEHYKFQNDMTVLKVTERVDGQPWIQSAITPAQGSNTLSPFVNLETR